MNRSHGLMGDWVAFSITRRVLEYRDARRSEQVSRLRRVIALRAMLAGGSSPQEVAESVGAFPACGESASALCFRLAKVRSGYRVGGSGRYIIL